MAIGFVSIPKQPSHFSVEEVRNYEGANLMIFPNDLWQGSCDDWIDRFIDRNLLAIGYTAILDFLEILTTYYPNDEIVILLPVNGKIDLNLLQGLAISPAECHAQVLKRWSEFQPYFVTKTINE